MDGPATASSCTVVIPSYQRRDHLAAILGSLADALQEPTGAEVDVLVLLDGSDDGSDRLVEQLSPGFPVPLRYVLQANRGRAAARNAGVAAADGELVWLLDDDIVVDRGALLCHLAHPRSDADVLVGPYEVASEDPDVLRAFWWYEVRHTRLAEARRVTDPRDISFANASAPRELLQAHRFDESFSGYGLEDVELAVRMLDAGLEVVFDADAAVSHRLAPSRSEMLQKMREEGVNRVRFVAMHPSHHDLAFPPDTGRLERALRQVSRLPSSSGLWLTARALDAGAGLRRLGARRQLLLTWAELIANYSGVAEARRTGLGQEAGRSSR